MVCAPVRSIIPELKLGDYLSVQAHKPCSISKARGLSLHTGAQTMLYLSYICNVKVFSCILGPLN